ncbi:hypothetical protein ACTD5D_04280 [Nocardia takedensis]|uniref:hypothetical protein n=1 Tax=Nocardia takedensis TaxID=259390 RepID=UPI000594A4D2|nr:hypothetical protein [Nocardia takedensis]
MVERVSAGGVGIVAAGFWVLCVSVVFGSRLSDDPGHDPHGYGLIFGTVAAVPVGAVAVALVPLAFVGRVRAQVAQVAWTVFLVVTVLTFVAWFTAA